MSRHACVYCGASMPHDGPGMLLLRVSEPGGSAVYLRWCMPCAETDPAHIALAEADLSPDDEPYARAYLDLHTRTAALGPDALRARIDVRREPADPRLTLRGDGLAWGILSRRV